MPVSGSLLCRTRHGGGCAPARFIGDIHGGDLPPERYMGEFRAWRDGRLYHNYARSNWEENAYDWYEGAVVRPDVILADLIHLLHPEILPDHELVFLGHFDPEEGR